MTKNIITIILAILVIDFIGFMLWVASGQMPADSFYIGGLTAKLLQVIIY